MKSQTTIWQVATRAGIKLEVLDFIHEFSLDLKVSRETLAFSGENVLLQCFPFRNGVIFHDHFSHSYKSSVYGNQSNRLLIWLITIIGSVRKFFNPKS